jgi:acetyl esterase/lipase
LLTTFRSPDWNKWQLALLAGEFGHWLAVGALATAAVAWLTRNSAGLAWPFTLLLAVGAMLLLLKPALEAKRAGGWAKANLDRLDAPAIAREPFSFAGLFGWHPNDVPVETLTFSGELALDFYRAVGRGNAPAPCLVVIHGGGWDNGVRDQLPGLNHWLAHRGYVVAAISYRLAPRFLWPAQREDTLAALAFLKANAARLGIDPSRFVLLGRSAGGQIAETVAYSAHDPAIRGVVGFYAPSDLNFAYKYSRDDDVLKSPALIRRFLGGPPETARENYDDASALRHVSPDSPPTLLLHGENDTLVWFRHSVRLEARLEHAGVPCVLVGLPWATHAFEFNLSGPGGQLTTYALERFLAKVMK